MWKAIGQRPKEIRRRCIGVRLERGGVKQQGQRFPNRGVVIDDRHAWALFRHIRTILQDRHAV
jgi:hypothetical protein